MKDVLYPSNNLRLAHLIFLSWSKKQNLMTLLHCRHMSPFLMRWQFILRFSRSNIQILAMRKNSNTLLCCSASFFHLCANFLNLVFSYVIAVFLILIIFVLHDVQQTGLPLACKLDLTSVTAVCFRFSRAMLNKVEIVHRSSANC